MENILYYFFFALSIVLIILGSIITGKARSDQDDIKHSGTGVLVLGLIFLVCSGFALLHVFGYTSKLY